MSKDLTTSSVARQNVLNNPYALDQLETHLALGGLAFEGETVFTKAQVPENLVVDERTIGCCLSSHTDGLKGNGYHVLKGKSLRNIKIAYVNDTDVVDILDSKVSVLATEVSQLEE